MKNLALEPFAVDVRTATIRPESSEGDAFYGLELGTNGTAATMRRTCALVSLGVQGLRWLRSNGKPATGIMLRGTGRVPRDTNPWIGR